MKPKFKIGDTVRRLSDGLEAKVISVDNFVCRVECADWTDTILEDQWELTHSLTKTSDQEESVSEDLEEAAESHIPECMWGVDVDGDGVTENGYDFNQMIGMFKAGAKWQKRQMLQGIEVLDLVDDYFSEKTPSEVSQMSVRDAYMWGLNNLLKLIENK